VNKDFGGIFLRVYVINTVQIFSANIQMNEFISARVPICEANVLVLVLVLVVDERGSFSAIDAHIFPCLIQTVLENGFKKLKHNNCRSATSPVFNEVE